MKRDPATTWIIVITVFCVGSLMCLALVLGRASEFLGFGGLASSAQKGDIAPNFTLFTPDDNEVELESFRGRPVLINFWATWCIPCVDEMPLIQKRYLENISTLVVLAINECESRTEVVDFMDDTRLSLPVLMDEDCRVGSRQYSVNAYPTSFFVDADGVIQAVVVGGMTPKVLDANLRLIGVGE